MNVNDFTQLYRRTVKKVSDGSTTVRLELSRIRAKRLRTLSHVTVENQTTTYTKCRLGINNGGNDHYLDEITDPEAEELAVARSDVILGEGDVFYAELTGTTANDVLIMTCVGWGQGL